MSYWNTTTNNNDDQDPPSRHRADDDLEALASGSFAPGIRTPNGITDLLDPDSSLGSSLTNLDASVSNIPYNEFNDSIGLERLTQDAKRRASKSKQHYQQQQNQLQHQHRHHPQDPSGEGEDNEGRSSRSISKEITTNSKEWVEKGTKLAEKTSQIMEEYRAYLTEIDSEFTKRGSVIEGETPSSSNNNNNNNKTQENRAEEYIEEVRSAYRDQFHDQHHHHQHDDASFAPAVDTTATLGFGGSGGLGAGGSQLMKRNWTYKDDANNSNNNNNSNFNLHSTNSSGFPCYRDHPSDNIHDVPFGSSSTIPDDDSTIMTAGFDHIRSFYGSSSEKRKYGNVNLFYSKRIKRGILAFVTACAIIGMVAGITSSVTKSRKEKNLPDWQAELEEVEKEDEEIKAKKKKDEKEMIDAKVMVGIERPPSTPEDMAQQQLTDEEKLKMDEITMKYQPKWFDRSNGWIGQTYSAALEFCASQESMIPCSYEAYCPLGSSSNSANSRPLGGPKQDVPTSWAPVYDEANEWVQVGKDGDTCVLYSEVNGSPPNWGVLGEENEEVTRHVMCCLEEDEMMTALDTTSTTNKNEEQEEPKEQQQQPTGSGNMQSSPTLTTKEQEILDTYHPIWFGRREGYHGTTWAEAKNYCKTEANMQLCPREAYCPNGISEDGSPPLFIQLDALSGEQWAPLAEEENSWVLIGSLHDDPTSTCRSHYEMNGRKEPQWGLDGTSTELKERILCCNDPSKKVQVIDEGVEYEPKNEVESQEALATPTASDSGSSANTQNSSAAVTAVTTPEKEPVNMELFMMNKMKPFWLGKKEGWNGGSHDDAIAFCQGVRGKKLCPYGAYCPNGAGHPVMGRHKHVDFDKLGEQWAPVYGKENHWIMIGQKDGNSATTCMSHDQLEGRSPDWGTNSENADVKLYVMCCTL